ncbi:MAG: ATP-binding cassette domain-containing protein [Chitinivibrionales bacterium]|nr:ATP-binding cassette domain-containing protein [Chitinivibrionales bacterium]
MKKKHLYFRMLSYIWPYSSMLGIAVLLSIFIVVFESISVWVVPTLLSSLFTPEKAEVVKPAFTIQNLNEIIKYWVAQLIEAGTPTARLGRVCIIFIISFSMKNLFLYVKSLIMAILNLNVVRDLRNELYGHALMLPVTYYDQNRSGKILSIILNDVGNVNAAMTNTFNKLITEPFRLISFVTILCIINFKLTIITFVVYPLLGFIIVKIGQSVRRRSKRVLENIEGLLSVLHETVRGVRTVKMFNMNEVETRKFRGENQNYTKSAFQSSKIRSLTSPLTEIFGLFLAVSLLWFGGNQVYTTSFMTGEDFIRFVVFLLVSYQPIKSMGGLNNTIQTGLAGAERVFHILDTETEPLVSFKQSQVPAFNDQIEYRHVNFTYPETDERIIQDVSFTIKRGHITALVGSSGCGKSTLLDLLPRFYDIESGGIFIDDKDIRECDIVGLRHLFGIVAQETVLFNDTVFNNIAYGVANPGREQVIAAANAANAMEFIRKLPKEFDTVIGENGIMLSGGQCQRISIARALLKNPPILILDEATSSLDTESERLVQNAINNLMENRTALVVAHRLSTIRHADQIIVLDSGRIVEKGTHEELIQLNNRYKYFYDIQFSSP